MANVKYGNIELTSDHKWKLFDVKPHVSLRLKQLFPRISEGGTQPYYLGDKPDVAADLTWFMHRYPLNISPENAAYLNAKDVEYHEHQASCELILSPEYSPSERAGFNEGKALRKYQGQAVDFVDQVVSALILDEIGLGKTIIGFGVALLEGALPIVYVVQPHLHNQWHKKAIEFLDLKIHKVVGGKPYSLPPADVYIMKYGQLTSWVDVLCDGWVNAIVFDEIQELRRGTETKKGSAASAICSVVRFKVGLTASLIYNYGIESYNIVNILRPGLLGSRHEFLREWCSESNDKGIVKDPDALGSYLREQNLIMRRTKKDVGQSARQLAPHVEWVDHNQKAVNDLEELTEQLAMKTFTASFQESGQVSREFDLRMRQMTGVAKAAQVAAFVRLFVESGKTVLLYGWHREVYSIWMEQLADLAPVMFTGSETPNQKEKAKERFISGESPILIMSLGSGAGTDGLQDVCSTVVFGEFAWSSEIHRQAIGRLDRDGQKEEVFVFYVATNFGSDPDIIDVLGLKSSQSKGILDPYSGGDLATQNDGNRIKNMAKSYLNKKGIKIPDRPKEKAPCKTTQTLEQLKATLNQGTYSVMDEKETQSQIADILTCSHIAFEKEKRFKNGIADFYLPESGIVIEVKANKQWNKLEVFRQCERYCEEESVSGILLATGKIQGLPSTISQKPASVFQLGISSL
ncbi:SNF2-related protein [Enterovibrio norvegicus]|uniref:SNF2-related protein n=1 Tax=Enterovibrio norvegicus TaxID=188144 RepID=UPI000C82B7BF|nr:DEAD/DEAH box helicase [Enterovibrio norvegicus]PMH64511.1 hypothetical protein BCU62_15770 [Enterovibrio norvegicus]